MTSTDNSLVISKQIKSSCDNQSRLLISVNKLCIRDSYFEVSQAGTVCITCLKKKVGPGLDNGVILFIYLKMKSDSYSLKPSQAEEQRNTAPVTSPARLNIKTKDTVNMSSYNVA